MKQYDIYVGGEFKKTNTQLKVNNPFSNEVFAETYLAGPSELKEAIIKALSIEKQLRNMPAYARYKVLIKIAHEIRTKKEMFTELLCMESGKPYKYSSNEIDRAVHTFVIAAEESKRLPKEYLSLDWTPAGERKEAFVKYFPIGLIAAIAPFNFPLNLAVHKIAPAIAAGCPLILKPASSTPLSTLELAKIIDKTELPKGTLSILPMNREAGNQLVTDERFRLLTFTGSPQVGWKMKNDAGKKKVVLELGGNAGVIITNSCDIKYAVKRCVMGGFAYSGQVCIHAQRIYVDETVFARFSKKFVAEVKTLKYGNPLDPQIDISVMIDEENAIRIEEWVSEAVNNGAKILCGGKRKGAYYEPTVLTNTTNTMKICGLENFGPVVILEKYHHFEQAVELINDSNYGLQAGVFTNNLHEVNIAYDNINAGGVIINDVPTFRVDHMPYGGIKDSGLGREGVKYAIHDMMEPKILVKNF